MWISKLATLQMVLKGGMVCNSVVAALPTRRWGVGGQRGGGCVKLCEGMKLELAEERHCHGRIMLVHMSCKWP